MFHLVISLTHFALHPLPANLYPLTHFTIFFPLGTGFDCFDKLANTANPAVSERQRIYRLLLKSIMEKYGFANYRKEWWHFTLKDEPYPDTYFDFVVKTP